MSPPGPGQALHDEAMRLLGEGRYAETLAFADDVLARRPRDGAALLARGNALTGLGRLDEAVEAFRAAIPGGGLAAFEALARLGGALAALGRVAPALEALDAAVALSPEDPLARTQRAGVRLQARDFPGGWEDYEHRWRAGQFVDHARGPVPAALIPELATHLTADGLGGQRVMLLGEQGIGDQVMFAGMIPDLGRTAASVVAVVEPRLVRLFAASFEGVQVASPATARIEREEIDRVVAMGSLGGAFRRTAADFPRAPYLRPGAAAVERWRERLGPRPAGLRIGLSWRGGLPGTGRAVRSTSLEAFAPILGLPGCEVISLQHGDVADEVAGAPIRVFPAAEIDDFEDLAALVANLDVVVSVQTALVHLCGAMGAECLALVRDNPGWRYLDADDGASLWYRSVQLLRQPRPGDWAPVIRDVADRLAARL